jgi:hypothetical protein
MKTYLAHTFRSLTYRAWYAVLIVAITAMAPLSSASAANNGLTSQVVAPDQVAYGRTYAEWSASWWQWALSIPAATHPLADAGPCSTGQSGQVFFLGGSFGVSSTDSRNCSVPSGQALFFPILNFEDSLAEEAVNPSGPMHTPLTTINELRQLIGPVMDTATNLQVDVDGKALKSLQGFRVQSVPFGFTLPVGNVFADVFGEAVAAGTYFPSVDDGFYVMLRPLATGSHTLHFHGTVAAFGFTLDITYHLTVTP